MHYQFQVILKFESFLGESCSASTQEDEDTVILSLKGKLYKKLFSHKFRVIDYFFYYTFKVIGQTASIGLVKK